MSYCDSQYCDRDYGQTQDATDPHLFWCNSCGYETHDWFIEEKVALINKWFDRAAGRYCDFCEQHGSHHTDKHEEILRAAQQKENSALHA